MYIVIYKEQICCFRSRNKILEYFSNLAWMFIFEKEVYLKLFQGQVLLLQIFRKCHLQSNFLTGYANVGIVKNRRTKYKN